MRSTVLRGSFIVGVCLGWATIAGAQDVPREMTIQGIVRDAAGVPNTGPTDFVFALTRGTATVWTESHTVDLTAGLFTITLGEENPIDPILFSMERISLVVTIETDTMDPIPLSSVAYAFRANTAATADAYDGDVDWGQLVGVPPAFADGTDDGSVYRAGDGLLLGGDTFSADFAGTGSAITVARSDHTHAWDGLTDIPAGFADGVDDVGATPSWGVLTGIPAGFADGVDDIGDVWSSLTGVPAGFADNVDDIGDVWSSLTGVPAGFADGIDDVGDAWAGLTGVPAGFADNVDDIGDAWAGLTGVPAGFADGVDNIGDVWSSLTGVPAGFADGIDDVGDAWASLTGVPAGFADNVDNVGDVWGSLTGVPPGFADGIDDVGGAPAWSAITAVPAGFADGIDNIGDAWAGLTGVPAGFADGIDDIGDAWAGLTGVPAGFADGIDNLGDTWAGLTGVPAGFADGIDDVGVGVPAGAVSFFNLAACPSGWTALAGAQGRYLVGLPPGGTLNAASGTALTNLESRPTGQHNHAISDPGHRHSTQLYGNSSGQANGIPEATDSSGGWGIVYNNYAATGITINNAGTTPGTNAPYLQLLVCQKN